MAQPRLFPWNSTGLNLAFWTPALPPPFLRKPLILCVFLATEGNSGGSSLAFLLNFAGHSVQFLWGSSLAFLLNVAGNSIQFLSEARTVHYRRDWTLYPLAKWEQTSPAHSASPLPSPNPHPQQHFHGNPDGRVVLWLPCDRLAFILES